MDYRLRIKGKIRTPLLTSYKGIARLALRQTITLIEDFQFPKAAKPALEDSRSTAEGYQ